jgi:arginine-tRNA-protein transferase
LARLLQRLVESPRPCSYLGGELASLVHEILIEVEPAEMELLLEHGWRRFGPVYFRPACGSCRACISLRVPVATFRPSRGQRRAQRRGMALRAEVGPVRVDASRLALHARWHAAREHARGWEAAPLSAEDYARQFGFPHPCGREIAYFDDHPLVGEAPRLVGVGLCDETPRAYSAIYFFHDPDYARWSPGVVHILNLLDLARRQGKAHVYLGFQIDGCASMRYKAAFLPNERLEGRPGADETPTWRLSGSTEDDA